MDTEHHDGAASAPARRRRPTPSWEAVWQGDGEAEAEIVAGRLRASGVRAVTQGAAPVPRGYPHAFLRDTWAVAVRSREAARARSILREGGDDPGIVQGDSGEGLTSHQKLTLRIAAAAGILFVALALLLPLYERAR